MILELKQIQAKKHLVVLFPYLVDKAGSESIMWQIKNFFQMHDITVFDVSDIIKNIPEKDLIVSKINSHPSVKLNKLIGEKLYEAVNESLEKEPIAFDK